MLPMLSKHTMISAALAATLSLSACGKKKDVITAPPQDPKNSQTENQNSSGDDKKTTAKIPNSESASAGEAGGQMGGGLPDPNTGLDTDFTDDAAGSDPTVGDVSVPGRPSNRPDVPPPVVDVDPVPVDSTSNSNTTSTSNSIEYVSNDANNVDRLNGKQKLTGGVAENGLLYTSSATDDLLAFIRARNSRVNEESRRNNLAAAAAVVHARISVVGPTGQGVVTLKIKEEGQVVTYNLAGAVRSGPESQLQLAAEGNGEQTTGTRPLAGTLKCLDKDGGCQNIFVRMKIGSTQSAIINVVFRYSPMSLWFSLPEKYSEYFDFLLLREMAINTNAKAEYSKNRLKSAIMRSWEVVNGPSGVMLSMKTYEGELMAFAGPLLAPQDGTKVSVRLSKLGKDQEDSFSLLNLSNSKLKLQGYISEARMNANNSLGQMRVVFTTRGSEKRLGDKFSATFMRTVKPIVELSDENLK